MIYLVRHGQTEFNAAGRFQGHLDSPLTMLGAEQASRIGDRLRDLVDDIADVVLISSPLGRTLRTAEIIRDRLGSRAEIEIEPRLIEITVGAWEGRTRDEVLAEHPTPSPGMLFESPGGETYDQVAARLSPWLAGLGPSDGRRRIVVSHGAAGWVLRGLYAGLPKAEVLTWPAPPQDAIFRLAEGRIERIDCAPAAA
jgi:broad specificity phosphatase PhoE